MVQWLRCSTRIQKVLCSNLSITIHGMTLDKSLTAQLSRMTHSYRTEYIISQYVGRKQVQIPPLEKDDSNWLHVDPNNNRSRPQPVISLWEVIIIIIKSTFRVSFGVL